MSNTQVMINGQLVDGSLAPKDRTFRDAWQLEGDAITVDMDKAREIHLDRLRTERKPLLEALDVKYQRADEVGDADAKADVVAQKQALRGITDDARIADASTPDELNALTLDVLLG